jgi:hypothetical protein
VLNLLRVLRKSRDDALFNIAALDRLLHHPTNAAIRPRNEDEPIELDGLKKALQKPNVIEITSDEPGAGKTHLLYLIVAIAVLPHSISGVLLNGNSSTVVLFDTDDRFSVERLVQVIRHYIDLQINAHEDDMQQTEKNPQPQPSKANIEDVISTSLQHIHIFRPQSLASTISTLQSLPSYLLDATKHHSSNRPLHSIIIDSITTYYWSYRASEDDARLASLDRTAPQTPATASQGTYSQLHHCLRALSHRFSCPIIATGTNPSSRYLGSEAGLPWPALPTLRLHVARKAVPKFAPALSIEEAMVEKEDRWKEVQKGQCLAVSGTASGGFGFWIRSEGVGVDEVE